MNKNKKDFKKKEEKHGKNKIKSSIQKEFKN
jgi:hypothetical protein